MARKKPIVEMVEEEYDDIVEALPSANEIRSETTSEDGKDDTISDAIAYKASKKQIMAKLRFHKHAPMGLKSALDMEHPVSEVTVKGVTVHLINYMPGVNEFEFITWVQDRKFWRWFLIDDDVEIAMYDARKKATHYLLSIMEMEDWDEERGKVDSVVLNAKMRVARMIIDKDVTQKTTVNKTNNVAYFGGGGTGEQIPKHLAKTPVSELESRVKALTEGATEND